MFRARGVLPAPGNSHGLAVPAPAAGVGALGANVPAALARSQGLSGGATPEELET